MSRRKIGDCEACGICGQDIVFWGRKAGWVDRGEERKCLVYQAKPGGEFTYPKTKHKPDKRT